MPLKYDAWNRLVEMGQPPYRDLPARYRYDGLGRRIRKLRHVNEITSYCCTLTEIYYDTSWRILEERREEQVSIAEGEPAVTDDLLYQYVWCQRYIDEPVLRDQNKNADGDCTDANDERLFYMVDANYNVTGLVDTTGETTGAVVERYYYTPYGAVTVCDPNWSPISASAKDNSILYCGYYRDAESGLYHVRHRMYHPFLGRWLQRDPIGYADGMSLYQYALSNPVCAIDRTALWTEATAKAELRSQIASWRGKGYDFAADLMQYFHDKKGPQDHTPTQANIDEVTTHARAKILDEIFLHIWTGSRYHLPDTDEYDVNITHPGKGAIAPSNIRWWYVIDNPHMSNAYGGGDLNVRGKAWAFMRRRVFLIFVITTGWKWSGNVNVRLGDLYTFDSPGVIDLCVAKVTRPLCRCFGV